MRKTHRPSLFHIEEVTQPQGHSTSGSHERYKSTERLAWELEFDCIKIMGEWLTRNKLLNKEDIEHLKAEARTFVRSERNAAWENYQAPMKKLRDELLTILENEPNDLGSLEKKTAHSSRRQFPAIERVVGDKDVSNQTELCLRLDFL
jgi:TPP-dependent pyruvate/acetoin dehydrogenase alpha subunit